MTRKPAILLIITLLAVLSLLPTTTQAQCAMCRATIESSLSSGESTIGSGLNKGILLLLAMPYTAIALVAFFWYRTSKKERAKRLYVANVLKKKLNLG